MDNQDEHEIKKTLVLDPERRNPFDPERKIPCRACKKILTEEELKNAVVVSAGMSVEDTFFPEKRRYYYHKKCYDKKHEKI
ncbi:MAG: hypothetical protein ACFFAS_13215 [Promethearchaeota archaeon]